MRNGAVDRLQPFRGHREDGFGVTGRLELEKSIGSRALVYPVPFSRSLGMLALLLDDTEKLVVKIALCA